MIESGEFPESSSPARSLKELMQLVYDDEGDSTTTSPTSVSSLRPLLEQPPNR
jgi:hypothetical protein